MITLFLFYTSFLATAFMVVKRSAIFLFVLYQFIYFLSPSTKWWGQYVPSLSYSFYIVFCLILACLFSIKKLKISTVMLSGPVVCLYILIFLYALASFYAVRPFSHSIALDAFLTIGVVVTAACLLCNSEEKLKVIIFGYIWSAAYLGYYITQLGRNSGVRVEGVGMADAPDSNGVAAAIAPALLFCLYYFWVNTSLKSRAIFALAGAFIANALVLINSRGAFVGVAIASLFFLWHLYFSKMQRKNQKKSVVAICLLGLVAVAVVTDDVFWQRMSTIKTERKIDVSQESGSTRILYWIAAKDMAIDHPFGGGAAAFEYYSPFYIPQEYAVGRSRSRAVHSTWFEALTEIGFLGILFFVLMLFLTFRQLGAAKKLLKKLNQPERYFKVVAIQSALISFVIAMSFLNRMRGEILYWCIVFSVCAYNVYVRNVNNDLPMKESQKP